MVVYRPKHLIFVLIFGVLPTCGQTQSLNVDIVTSDIDNFWMAYDSIQMVDDNTDKLRIIKNLYFEHKSKGLEELLEQRRLDEEMYVNSIEENHGHLDSIRGKTLDLGKLEGRIESVFKSYDSVYPKFFVPKVCFFMGVYLTNATVSNDFSWVLFGTELMVGQIFGSSPKNFEFIVAHEATHIQQLRSSGFSKKLLFRLLMEGGADFVAEKVTGIAPYDIEVYNYGALHESELWKEVSTQLESADSDSYFGSSERADRPQRLGYYIGYQICKSYYDSAKNKGQALVDIIEIDDPYVFLSLSGYDGKFN